jgi:hypothetical protein
MVAAKSIILTIIFLDAISSTMVILCSRLSSDIDQAIQLLFPGILVLILLPMVIDYFNGCARTRSLGIAAQIKIMGEPLLVFLG